MRSGRSLLSSNQFLSSTCIQLTHSYVQLIFLSEANITDRMFVRDFVHNFKFQQSITVHAPAEDLLKTRMLTKRISSLLSDTVTYNRAFSGDQRGLVKELDGKLNIEKSKVDPLLEHVQTLIIGPIALKDGEAVIIDPMKLVLHLRELYGVEEIITFSDNPLSPLVAKKPLITSQEEVDKWLIAYEEEKEALRRALQLRPARLSSPVNYAL